jgi:cell division protein FtsQ
MKKWLRITLWILFAAGVVTVLVFSQQTQEARSVKKTDMDILIHVSGENAFLNEHELYTRLKRRGYLFEGQLKKDLKIGAIEKFIAGMTEVKSVRVFTEIGSGWKIDVVVRKPIARIFNRYGETYYLDEDGVIMQTSPIHTARVVVVSGYLKDRPNSISVTNIINNDSLKSIRKLDDVYRISNYVCKDPYMQSLIGQIHLKKDGDFVLIPIVGGQEIIFGTANTDKEVSEKFRKLKIFYKEAIPYEGWDKYTEINLKYDRQIVGKTRENNEEEN